MKEDENGKFTLGCIILYTKPNAVLPTPTPVPTLPPPTGWRREWRNWGKMDPPPQIFSSIVSSQLAFVPIGTGN